MPCPACERGRCCRGSSGQFCYELQSCSECAYNAGVWDSAGFGACGTRACIDTTGAIGCFTQNYCQCTYLLGRTFVSSVTTCDCAALTSAGYARGGCQTGQKCCGPVTGCQPIGTLLGNFTVNVANNGWLDTGIDIASGQGFVISASGSVQWAVGDAPATPNGVPAGSCDCCAGCDVDTTFCHMALLGRIGPAGAIFLAGSSSAHTAAAAGRLYLRQNDTCVGDNTGTFTGSVTSDPCPGYTPASVGEPRVLPPESKAGPGASLKWLLSLAGIHSSPTCPCNARAAEMDSWGELGCLKRLPVIVGWLAEEAGKRKLRFFVPAGYALVFAAIAHSALTRPWRGNSQ